MEEFARRFEAYVEEHISDEQTKPMLDITGVLDFRDINYDFYKVFLEITISLSGVILFNLFDGDTGKNTVYVHQVADSRLIFNIESDYAF